MIDNQVNQRRLLMKIPLDETLLNKISKAQFFMLRYETEYTPCTGITAVTRQERRHFKQGVMIAPWCPNLRREKPEHDPLINGKVKKTDWSFKVRGLNCQVLVSTDEHAPILFLGIEGRFNGFESPYDLPLKTLHADTLWFGLAVEKLLKLIGNSDQFVWGGDWETVPALYRLRKEHLTTLTLHNTFDECLANETRAFGSLYNVFNEIRKSTGTPKTALEIGLEFVDVATTVNRGFAWGLVNEPIQTRVMASHLQHLLDKVTGINNAAFSNLSDFAIEFKRLYKRDPEEGRRYLFKGQKAARANLPKEWRNYTRDKVLVVSMGRRVSQKQHDLVVESTRHLLNKDKKFPLFVVFATMHGDDGSPARLERMQALQAEFKHNVVCLDGRIPFYETLMQAADYNCMPSLYEPHGGAFEGTVIPIARAVDGLAEQICGFNPRGQAAVMNKRWHTSAEKPPGILFREADATIQTQLTADLAELLSVSPSPNNDTFKAMQDSLSEALIEAVNLRIKDEEKYAEMVLAAIEKQENTSWDENLKGLLALVEEARTRRDLARQVPTQSSKKSRNAP